MIANTHLQLILFVVCLTPFNSFSLFPSHSKSWFDTLNNRHGIFFLFVSLFLSFFLSFFLRSPFVVAVVCFVHIILARRSFVVVHKIDFDDDDRSSSSSSVPAACGGARRVPVKRVDEATTSLSRIIIIAHLIASS